MLFGERPAGPSRAVIMMRAPPRGWNIPAALRIARGSPVPSSPAPSAHRCTAAGLDCPFSPSPGPPSRIAGARGHHAVRYSIRHCPNFHNTSGGQRTEAAVARAARRAANAVCAALSSCSICRRSRRSRQFESSARGACDRIIRGSRSSNPRSRHDLSRGEGVLHAQARQRPLGHGPLWAMAQRSTAAQCQAG